MNFSVWDLPGPESFASNIANDIRIGRNVFLLLPEIVPDGLYEAIKKKLDKDRITLERLSACQISQSSPIYDLHQVYNTEKIKDGDAFCIYSLCQSEKFRSRVIWLDDVSQQTSKKQEWYDFFRQYSVACGQQNLIDRSLFIIPIYGKHTHDSFPAENLLTHHWFWGKITILDMQIFASKFLGSRQDSFLLNRLFINIITALSGYDLLAAYKLCQVTILDESEIINSLKSLATERTWHAPIQEFWGEIDNFTKTIVSKTGPNKPNHSLMDLWSCGILDIIDGRIIISPVAEIARDNLMEIRQRIWRGHVQTLLPIVDEYRLKVITYLEENYGSALTFLNDHENEILEIGKIKYHIESNPKIQKRVDRNLRNFIRLLSRVRNDLAHLKPISLEIINRLENLENIFCKI